ncbi:MAG: terminase [Candidatus Limivicinus sp.]|nr:terminase [Candidatus Limivicinus sp.]
MPKKRIGRQTPTRSFILPYRKSFGAEAAELYNSTGRKAQKWQELLLRDMMAVTSGKNLLWKHTKFGYSVPRRNGKNEVVAIREMWGLTHGEHILHTAHRTTTTHSAWERLLDLLAKAEIEVVSSYRAYGKEHIELADGGKIEFRTRTSKGGLGEGFDLLVIDEAQEYQDDQESALKYVVSDSKNPQTIFLGTPPTPVSSGTVFPKLRSSILTGQKENAGWAEWSVDKDTDPRDKDAWYETNPSLGTVLTERSITDEIGSDRTDFNIQRLGRWIQYNQKSAISHEEWEALKLPTLPELKGRIFVGIKYNHDAASVSLSIALRTTEDKIFVETVDCRETRAGNGWMIAFLHSLSGHAKRIVVDGANGQNLMAEAMKEARLQRPYLPTVKEIITANAFFEQQVFTGGICHMGQPALAQAVENCEHRAIGSNGGFGYRAILDGVDISLLDSAVLACWAAEEFKEKPCTQKMNY